MSIVEREVVNYLFTGKQIFMFTRKKIKERFMITIPEPCSEDWNKMTVVDREHKHCSSCEKLVVDFTSMSTDEIVLFLHHNKEKTCGRFTSTQLGQTYNPLPQAKHTSKWWKAAMFLPLSFLSKNATAQQNDSLSINDSLTDRQETSFIGNDTAVVSNDSLANPNELSADSVIASVDSTTSDDFEVDSPLTRQKTEVFEVVISSGSMVYGGFAPQQIIYNGGMVFEPAPNPTLLSVGCVYNPTPDPVYPIGVFPNSWTFWKWQKKHKMEYVATNPEAIAAINPNDKKKDPVPPPIPKAPWYEAILPSSLRLRRNG